MHTPCSEILDDWYCRIANGCAWDHKQDTCSQFKGCSSYEDVYAYGICASLDSDCYYDVDHRKCEDRSKLPKCSEQLQSQCFQGREGLCVIKDGKCQEFTNCEDVDKKDMRCKMTQLACDYYYQPQCTSLMGGCKNNLHFTCGLAQETINESRFSVCKQRGDEECIDWDPLEATMETCLLESFRFYHWKDNKCDKCQSLKFGHLLETVILLIMLAF